MKKIYFLQICFLLLIFNSVNLHGYFAATELNSKDSFIGSGLEIFHGDHYYNINGKKEDLEFSLTDRVLFLEFFTPVNKTVFLYYRIPFLWRDMEDTVYKEYDNRFVVVKGPDYYRKGPGDVLFNLTYKIKKIRLGMSVNIPTGSSTFAYPKIPLGLGRWNLDPFIGYVTGEKIKYRMELSYSYRMSQSYDFVDPYGVYFFDELKFKDRLYLDGGFEFKLFSDYSFSLNLNYYHEVAKNKNNLLSGNVGIIYRNGSNEISMVFDSQIYGKIYPDYPYLPQIFWSEGRPAGWSIKIKFRWFNNEKY